MISLAKYTSEISDFLSEDTLYAIDYGILDLGRIKDMELKNVFYYLEELLTVELRLNYRLNSTGIFRVYLFGNLWCYCEGHSVITAGSYDELKEKVTAQTDYGMYLMNIWQMWQLGVGTMSYDEFKEKLIGDAIETIAEFALALIIVLAISIVLNFPIL